MCLKFVINEQSNKLCLLTIRSQVSYRTIGPLILYFHFIYVFFVKVLAQHSPTSQVEKVYPYFLYSRPSVARTSIARLPRLFRTCS